MNEGTVGTRNATVSGLTKATNYRFGVKAVNAGGSSSVSWVDAKTEGTVDPEPPTPPSGQYYEQFSIPATEEDGVARAFPGAEGGGMFATGGRGGKVLHVTNLNDSGEGSLRWACSQNYPRIIVFDVAGVIELQSQLRVDKNDCTIAGQTAPGDGICLKNYTFRISASNVIVRFIRCRMGDELKTEDDAMQVMSHDDDKYKNIIIDHCSVSWCTDECASFYGMRDFTFQWNIVSESLRVSVHDKGNHGYGGIWGGNNATYHHNLLAHHDSRNPRIDHDYVSTQKGPVSIVDNVVYNWKGNTCYGGESANTTNTYRKYNFLNNYYKPGPETPSNHIWFLDPTTSCSNCTNAMGCSTVVPGHFYMTGNYMYGKDAMTADNWTGTTAKDAVISTIKSSSVFADATVSSYLTVHQAQKSFDAVLAYSGASHERDKIDTRIADETKNGTYTYKGSKGGTKGLIDTQSDVGGWPEYKFESTDQKLKDSDSDGMPDWFEEKFGLNKSNKDDAAQITLDKYSRYTNLEMYLHYLVKDIVSAQNAGGTYTKF